MKSFFLPLIFACGVTANAQVGINTTTPETTLEVVGKPDKPDHFDGIIPPRITGDQLASKNFTSSKKGAIVYVTSPASNLAGQVIHIVEEGYYYFNGNYWMQMMKEPTYYDGLIVLDSSLPANKMSSIGTWSSNLQFPTNPRQHTFSSKLFRLGTAGLGISGQIDARRIGAAGVLDISINCSTPFTSNYVQLDIGKPLRELGFMSDGSTGSIVNILVSGTSKINPDQIEQGLVSLSNSGFQLLLWKNQIEKFSGQIKGMITFPINYLNVINLP